MVRKKPRSGNLITPSKDTGAVSSHMTPDRQASHFARARRARETETVDDYLELIADLIDDIGEARVVDISKRLGVSNPTVTSMIARLKKMDLVDAEPYRSIFLTDKGRYRANASRERHHIVLRLLRAVGVDEANAWADAEAMEHCCSPDTLRAFENFLQSYKP